MAECSVVANRLTGIISSNARIYIRRSVKNMTFPKHIPAAWRLRALNFIIEIHMKKLNDTIHNNKLYVIISTNNRRFRF